MKTKTFLLLCLFLGIGLTKLSAQNSKNGTGSVNSYYSGVYWWAPILCDGVWVDELEGSGDAHYVEHYSNGVWKWAILNYSGVGTSLKTGETFTFSEQDKFFNPKHGDYLISTHVKGDKGALYNISFICEMDDDGNVTSMVVKNATCTGNSK
jgi:hypothetical protein